MKTHNGNQIRTACLVVPTYNESENIVPLLKKIFSVEKKNRDKYGFSLKVLVVDDSSPDGTAKMVLAYQKNNSNVHILVRKHKEGLGKAYIAGIFGFGFISGASFTIAKWLAIIFVILFIVSIIAHTAKRA